MLLRYTILLLIGCSFVCSTAPRFLSRQTRANDVSFLERLTLPYRQNTHRTHGFGESLIDFLASRRGLLFLASHIETLWYQELLEIQYGRKNLCNNMKKAEVRKNGLAEKERRLKNCLCRFYMPFLHCLAIGSQLLREAGLFNGRTLNMNSTLDASLNEGKPIHLSWQDENSDTLGKEEEETPDLDCIPKFIAEDKEVYYGGHCTVPISGLLTIELDHKASTGYQQVLFFDAIRCAVCGGMDGRDCLPLCRDNIETVETLVDHASARLVSRVCLNLRQVGEAFSTIFGIDGCFSEVAVELFFYQRMLKLEFRAGMGSWRVVSELRHKFDNGPDCTCRLRTFKCTEACRMKKNALMGGIGIEWDFFFGDGAYMRYFNGAGKCYTDHEHFPEECPTSPPSFSPS